MVREMADKEHNLLDKLVHSALFADSIGASLPVEHRPKMSLYGRPLELLGFASGCPFEPRETESRSTDETKRTPVVRTRGRGRRW